MPQELDNSEYNQLSFIGGMNLLLEDTDLQPNQYRIGFNVRNRFGRLDPVLSSQQDTTIPAGIIQEVITFGNYVIAFVSGSAYWKLYYNNFWTRIPTFAMSQTAPRYWTEAVPVATTNYLRLAAASTIQVTIANSEGTISVNNVSGAAAGNLPGLVVQDNINQPSFIFIDATGIPVSKVTQKFEEWSIQFTDANNVTVSPNGDKREYVPVGNAMKYIDGILYTVSPDFTYIYRSVSGRPLDFVINVSPLLVTNAPFIMVGGGDATTTGYSVGVGGITALRELSDGSLFVASSNANFSVAKNLSNNAPFIFGEYTFLRKFLFNAVCLSDRAIFDSQGDTRFITLTGVRSFNAIAQTQNEGRNSLFSSNIKSAFGNEDSPIIQDSSNAAAILFNDYELYAVNTVFGPAIGVFDTINGCWSSFDISQTGGKRVKQFAKIELTSQVLFAVTEDNKLYRLYAGPGTDVPTIRTVGICSNILYANQNIKMANPRKEIQPIDLRVIFSRLNKDAIAEISLYINDRLSAKHFEVAKFIPYSNPPVPSDQPFDLDDVDTMLSNALFSLPGAEQGWKAFFTITWNNGSVTQLACSMKDLTPMNPLNSQLPKSFKNTSV